MPVAAPPPPVGAVTVNPNHGPQSGGTSVAITVNGLGTLGGLLAGLSGVLPNVTFGGTAATACTPITVGVGSVSFNCTTPAHAAGLVDVAVTGALILNSSTSGAFTYDPAGGPPATGGNVTVSPNQGPTTGGQTVTITVPSLAGIVGLSLLPVVTFGGTAATGCSLINATVGTGTVSFTCITPAHALGPVNVEVKDVLGLLFDYTGIECLHVCRRADHQHGPLEREPEPWPRLRWPDGHDHHSEYARHPRPHAYPQRHLRRGDGDELLVGIGASVGSPTVSFTCVTPAHVAGLVDVTVTDLLGLIDVTGIGVYTYDNGSGPPPVGGNVTVVPNQGPVAGGQTVTITVPSVAGWSGSRCCPT